MHYNVTLTRMDDDRTPLDYVARRNYRIPTFLKNMTENDVKNYSCQMTKKCYLILRQIHGKEFALESIKLSPFSQKNDNLKMLTGNLTPAEKNKI